MGCYIETPFLHGKASWLTTTYGATPTTRPHALADIPAGQALICVVDNTFFEAAAYIYSDHELNTFLTPDDDRPQTWLLLDEWTTQYLTGYWAAKPGGVMTIAEFGERYQVLSPGHVKAAITELKAAALPGEDLPATMKRVAGLTGT